MVAIPVGKLWSKRPLFCLNVLFFYKLKDIHFCYLHWLNKSHEIKEFGYMRE